MTIAKHRVFFNPVTSVRLQSVGWHSQKLHPLHFENNSPARLGLLHQEVEEHRSSVSTFNQVNADFGDIIIDITFFRESSTRSCVSLATT